jgi:microcystin-dependent protein
MSWNGSGSFNRIMSWIADRTAGIDISSSRMDSDTNDITSNGFGNCLTRDGQGFATNNLPMAGFRHTGVGSGVARTDYAALGQVEDGVINWAVAGGTADALTVTLSPAVTALIDGQLFFVRAGAANATTTPTFQANATTAHTITKNGGAVLAPNDIAGAGHECVLRYNLANTRFELLNPANVAVPIGTVLDFTGSTAPSNFVLAFGQQISRTTFAAYFALVGTTYGSGDGSTTFNVPDLRGRVLAGIDNMGGSAANRIGTALVTDSGTINGQSMGSAGGSSTHTQATGEVGSHGHGVNDNGHTHTASTNIPQFYAVGTTNGNAGSLGGFESPGTAPTVTVNSATAGITIANNAAPSAMAWMQPTMMLSKIIRVQ